MRCAVLSRLCLVHVLVVFKNSLHSDLSTSCGLTAVLYLFISANLLKMPVPNSMNPDLVKERKNASFKSDEMAAWFYGGEANLQIKRIIEQELYNDLGDPMDVEFLSYEDLCTVAVKDAIAATNKLRALQHRINPGGSEVYPTLMGGPVGSALMPCGNPFAVHLVMFTRALKGQGTAEQYEKFGRRADNCEIIGTYAQTELGHGTYLRGLETRADYHRESDEFVLNTPTLTSYKWWPGGLGQTANYCIVVAQMYIDNQDKGVHLFVVQIRDEETHKVLPGIDVGEIGKKIGMLGVNNGYLGLKNVRIPRTNMLMKNSQLKADGTYIKSPVSQLAYFPMVYVRCMVALSNSLNIVQAATVTTRYSAVRRQSPINPNEPEPQIIDHLTQQMKVFPEIATGIVHRLAAGKLLKLYEETAVAINKQDFSRLPELHALACILKVACSYDSSSGIEKLRQACGGHGYLTAANLGNLWTVATAACTYEGENSVLYLQVGKILLKAWADVELNKQLMPTMAYLSICAQWSKFPKWTNSWQTLVNALEYACTNKTRLAYKSYNERLKKGQSIPEAVNNTGIELTQAAELHGRAFLAHTFFVEVTGSKALERSPEFNKVLENLLELFLVYTVQKHLQDVLRFIDLTEDDIAALQERLETVLAKIRPDAVAIVDGFDFHDKVLNSTLGSYDGNVYERIFESAKKSPINKQEVPKMFELYLKPFMKSNM